MKDLVCTILVLLILHPSQAKVYTIHNAEELQALQLQAGDTVIMSNGDWNNQELIFKGNGTESAPIVLTAATPGKVVLQGNSSLQITGTCLVVNGLLFTNGHLVKKDVVTLAQGSSQCRLTNTAVIDYNPADKKDNNVWISVYGTYNRVDHCYLKGKTNIGPTMVIWRPSDAPDHHRIDHNYFDARPELGENGGETMRIGTSHHSLSASYTLVEQNYFKHCDGELEIVSNKSCNNIIRYNSFYECKGTLTLRHGNNSEVYGNYFEGNGLSNTGGIRIIGEGHQVYNNHMQNLTGTGVSAALSLMDGLPNPQLTSHWQVKRAQVKNNTILNCKENFAIGVGKNETRNLPPLDCSITGNQVLTQTPVIKWYDSTVQIAFDANIVKGSEILPQGFIMGNPAVHTAAQNNVPDSAAGPAWMKLKGI